MKKLFVLLIALIAIAGTQNSSAQKVPVLAINPSFQYNMPFGNFGDYWGSGMGLNFAIETNLTGGLNAGVQVGYFFWTPVAENQQFDLVCYNIPIEIYGLYYFENAGGFIPYAGLEIGYNLSTKSSETISLQYVVRDTYNSIGVSPVFGFITNFSDGMLLDANIKYSYIGLEENNTLTYEGALNYISINLGVMFEI